MTFVPAYLDFRTGTTLLLDQAKKAAEDAAASAAQEANSNRSKLTEMQERFTGQLQEQEDFLTKRLKEMEAMRDVAQGQLANSEESRAQEARLLEQVRLC